MGSLDGLIVTQIAATVVFTATAYVVHRQAEYIASVRPSFRPPSTFSAARNGIEGAAEEAAGTIPARHRQRFAAAVRELERRSPTKPRLQASPWQSSSR